MTTGRIGRRTRLHGAAVAEYKDWHTKVWPALLEVNTAAGIRNYSIFIDGTDLFSYFEVEDLDAAVALLNSSPMAAQWQDLMAPFMDAPDAISPWAVMEEVFHQD